MMNTDVKAKWTAALRSGAYSQTKYNLKNVNGFCCLGVLCDLYLKENPGTEYKWSDADDAGIQGFAKDNVNLEWAGLPFIVQEWSGLKVGDPQVQPNENVVSTNYISAVNDSSYFDFHGIANLIETQL